MDEKIVKDSQGLAKDLANDCISRSGVSAWLANRGYRGLANKVMDEDRFPSAQPEIIRCRECKYWEREKPFATSGRCFIWECANRKGSDYCSEARKVSK